MFGTYENVLSHVSIFFVRLDVFNLVDNNQFSPFSFSGIVRLGGFCLFFMIILSLIRIPKRVDSVDGFKIAIFDKHIAYELNRVKIGDISLFDER